MEKKKNIVFFFVRDVFYICPVFSSKREKLRFCLSVVVLLSMPRHQREREETFAVSRFVVCCVFAYQFCLVLRERKPLLFHVLWCIVFLHISSVSSSERYFGACCVS